MSTTIKPSYQMNIMMPIRFRAMSDCLARGIWTQSQVICAGLLALNSMEQKDRDRLLLSAMSQAREDHTTIKAGKKLEI